MTSHLISYVMHNVVEYMYRKIYLGYLMLMIKRQKAPFKVRIFSYLQNWDVSADPWFEAVHLICRCLSNCVC